MTLKQQKTNKKALGGEIYSVIIAFLGIFKSQIVVLFQSFSVGEERPHREWWGITPKIHSFQ